MALRGAAPGGRALPCASPVWHRGCPLPPLAGLLDRPSDRQRPTPGRMDPAQRRAARSGASQERTWA
eukprot:2361171-Lingulodinium_polyedra.AAC.1